jgi:hypothetical protein
MNHDSSRPRLHHGRVAAALICLPALAGLAACSSSTSSSSSSSPASSSAPASASASSAPSPSSSSVAAGAPACANGTLQVKLGESEGYAGGVDVPIDFTNTSGASCTLFGYPGVSLLSAAHAQIGLAAKRGTTVPPVKVITLAPGATVTAQLQIADALNFPTATCSPVQATDLRVYPPNQTVAVLLPEQSKGCAKPVQVLLVGAVQSASA